MIAEHYNTPFLPLLSSHYSFYGIFHDYTKSETTFDHLLAKAGDITVYAIIRDFFPRWMTYGSHAVAEELKSTPLGMMMGSGMVFGFGIDGFRDRT